MAGTRKKVAAIPKESVQLKHARPQPEILEELATSIRSLDSKFREIRDEGPRGIRNRWRKFHPMMIHEVSHMIGEKRGDPIALLVMASMFRDDLPWMYELGVEAYRVAKNGTPAEAVSARKRFQKAAEIMRQGHFGPEEMNMDPRLMHMIVRELDRLLDSEPETEARVEESAAQTPKRKKGEKPE